MAVLGKSSVGPVIQVTILCKIFKNYKMKTYFYDIQTGNVGPRKSPLE